MKRRRLSAVAILLVVVTISLWQVSKARTFQMFGRIVSSVPRDDKVVALTFDDGPTPEGTRRLLAVLWEHDVKATFFLTGEGLTHHPESGRAIVDAGHQIGNHGFSHVRMVLKSPAFVRSEIERTDQRIREAGFSDAILFRPPYCKKLFVLPWFLKHTGRTTITWDVEPESYSHVEQTPIGIATYVLDNVKPGSIILLHAMHDPKGVKTEALRLILNGLRARSYHPITVADLLTPSAV